MQPQISLESQPAGAESYEQSTLTEKRFLTNLVTWNECSMFLLDKWNDGISRGYL